MLRSSCLRYGVCFACFVVFRLRFFSFDKQHTADLNTVDYTSAKPPFCFHRGDMLRRYNIQQEYSRQCVVWWSGDRNYIDWSSLPHPRLSHIPQSHSSTILQYCVKLYRALYCYIMLCDPRVVLAYIVMWCACLVSVSITYIGAWLRLVSCQQADESFGRTDRPTNQHTSHRPLDSV